VTEFRLLAYLKLSLIIISITTVKGIRSKNIVIWGSTIAMDVLSNHVTYWLTGVKFIYLKKLLEVTTE